MTESTTNPSSDTKSTPVVIVEHLVEHHYKYVYVALVVLGLIGLGYWWGTSRCTGMSETEARQLKGDLSDKEKKIVEADATIGKVQTELQNQKDLNQQLTTLTQSQQDDVAKVQKANGLLVQQIARLSAQFSTHRTDGSAGIITTGGASECGACQGQVRFGNPAYATCTWADYAKLKAGGGGGSVDLALGVKIDHVTLKQQPKNGSLEAVIDRVFLTDSSGATIAEGKLDPSSRVFTAPNELGDQARRHFYVIGGIGTQNMKLGLATQKGFKPFWYGGAITRDWNAQGRLGFEALFGFQFR